MDQATLIETLLEEWNSNKQAIEAVQSETDAIAQALRLQRTGTKKDHETANETFELASQLNRMTRLLERLRGEQEQAEKELHIRLAQLLDDLKPASPSQESLERGLQAMGCAPSAGLPKRGLTSVCKRLARLGTHGVHILKTEGCFAFLFKGTRRIYRKLATSLSWRHQPAAPAGQPHLPYIFRPAEGAREKEYGEWITRNEPSAEDLNRQRHTVFSFQPRISMVVPSYNTPLPFLLAMIESVRAQTYPHWELCIADGGSHNQFSKKMLEYYAHNDSRIKVIFLPTNEGIAGNSKQALSLATGEYVALLDHDDTLSPFALFEIVAALNHYPDADFLYSDEDRITETGEQRFAPHFKPAWSPDTLRSLNYITHLTVIERLLLKRVGGFRLGFDGSQDYDLILRATEQAKEIVHIPKILYHWRSHPRSVAGDSGAKPYAFEAAKKALREHLHRCGIDGHVQRVDPYGYYRILHHLPRRPLVSIIIPNKDHHTTLRHCLESIFCSTYTNYEIVIIENNSQDPNTFAYYDEVGKRPEVRVIPWNHPFNYAAAINFGVRQSRGEMLLLLNNDIEVINRDWLECLLEYGLRPDVGAVGAKLYYPNNSIQHGGVVIGLGGFAGHMGVSLEPHNQGYMARLITVQNMSAVTAACLLTSRSAYKEVGGLDERFVVALNDIDYCLKLRSRGYWIVWTPYAQLYHFESLSRGSDDTTENRPRFQSEQNLFIKKWKEVLDRGDPFYSPNQSLQCCHWSIRTNGAGPQHPRIVSRRGSKGSLAA